MIKISKAEALTLNKMGVPFGENGISHTYTKHKTYYLCESRQNMNLYKRIKGEN